MNKIVFGGLALVLGCGNVIAANCTGDVTAHQIAAPLDDQTICASSVSNGDTWQEWHQAGGALWEWAQGTNPIDHSRVVGSWSGNAKQVTYDYGGGQVYTFEIWRTYNPTSVPKERLYYCESGGSTVMVAEVTKYFKGQAACN